MSYGECESDMSSAATIGVGYYNTQWEQFAAEGITAVVSAGNSDASDAIKTARLRHPKNSRPMGSAARLITSRPEALNSATPMCRTITRLTQPPHGGAQQTPTGLKAVSYIPETALSGYCSNALFASYLQNAGSNSTPDAACKSSTTGSKGNLSSTTDGGTSTYTNIPTWQSAYGVGIKPSASPLRSLPDISMFALSGLWGHFLPYCESDTHPCTHSEAVSASGLGAGGTSFVAPQFAGLIALASQKTNSRQGQANYTIYDLAEMSLVRRQIRTCSVLAACSGSGQGANIDNSCIFHDISEDLPSLQGGHGSAASNQLCKGTDRLLYRQGEQRSPDFCTFCENRREAL